MTSRIAGWKPAVSRVPLAGPSSGNAWRVPLLVGSLGLGADQLSKFVVRQNLPVGAAIPSEGLLRLRHVVNDGIIFGVDADPAVSLVLPFLLIVAILLLCQRYVGFGSLLLNTALALFVCGGLGNLIDRLALGHVTDFIDLGLPVGGFGVALNVADLTVMAGAVLFISFVVNSLRQTDGRHPQPTSL